MKKILSIAALLCAATLNLNAQTSFPRSAKEDSEGYMSKAYWALWNEEEQARIDADIERYR